MLGESEAARTKAYEEVKQAQLQLLEVANLLRNTVAQHEKNMKVFLTDREQKLNEAISHTRGLGSDITAGFGRLIQQAITPLKQRLMQTLIVAGSSIVGGVLVFLLCTLLFQGDLHTASAKTVASTTPTATHTTTNKSK